MFRLAVEAYLLMFFTLLHLTVLSCDSTCLLPVPFFKSFLPKVIVDFSMTILDVLQIDILTAQIIGQFMVIGDIFICILVIIKLFGAILKRFILMMVSMILAIVILHKVYLIWMISIELFEIIYALSFFHVSSCLSLIIVLFLYLFLTVNVKFPMWMNVW